MAEIAKDYQQLPKNYLFREIKQRKLAHIARRPGVHVYDLGIGDVSLPLPSNVTNAMAQKALSLEYAETFTGYEGSEGGVELKNRIAEYYHALGADILPQEIFINDGAKGDCADVQTLFASGTTFGLQDPAYPVYANSIILSGKAGEVDNNGQHKNIVYLECTEENDFIPDVPKEKIDVIYLCFPNNPTGATASEKTLKKYVDYANDNKAILIFDAAYSWFIRETDKPKSIYEVEGANTCAIEIQSLSKAAGFTGVRLGWTVIPQELSAENVDPGEINQLWRKRQQIHFNGPSNVAQAGGEVILSPTGLESVVESTNYYLNNAKSIKATLAKAGIKSWGGVNAPYVWSETPTVDGKKLSSWEAFDHYLERANVIATPGVGFGPSGEGFTRFSAFGKSEDNDAAIKAIVDNLQTN
ncbi:LL-diaminopimelate aminotransferase [Candidatus Saccharibacteria bacterium]|nr:LL-diaminopimelate aminotransferase [Candidatus Saccharibacteria bacterium]